MPRSLRVHLDCIERVKQAVHRSGFPRQKDLAEELGLSISTVNSFLNGKPVDCENFLEICKRLSIDWKSIINSPAINIETPTELNILQEHSLQEIKSQEEKATKSNRKILWVDDNLSHIHGEIFYLVDQGFKISISNETFDALQKFQTSSFDIVITDMGRFENGLANREAGLEIAQEIRKINKLVPIILFCARGRHWIRPDEKARKKGIEIGVNKFIFSTDELYEYFESWMSAEI